MRLIHDLRRNSTKGQGRIKERLVLPRIRDVLHGALDLQKACINGEGVVLDFSAKLVPIGSKLAQIGPDLAKADPKLGARSKSAEVGLKRGERQG